MNVIALLVPLINVARAGWNLVPFRILVRKIAIKFAERFRCERGLHDVPDFAESRPQIAKESFFTVLVLGKRVAGKINVNSARQGERDHQRRRHQKIRLDMLMHACFEIPISRKNRSCNQIVFVDRFLDVWMQWTGVADASRAAVTDEVKPELVEIFLQSGFRQIIGNHARARRERGFHCRIHAQSALHRLFCEKAGRDHHARIASVCATCDCCDQNAAVANVRTSLCKDLPRFGLDFCPRIGRWPVSHHFDFVEFVPRVDSLVFFLVG